MPDALGERLQHAELDLRRVVEQRAERAVADHERADRRGRLDRRAARGLCDERDLAEEVARAHRLGDLLAAALTSTVPSISTKNSRPASPCFISIFPSGRSISSAIDAISASSFFEQAANSGTLLIRSILLFLPSSSRQL